MLLTVILLVYLSSSWATRIHDDSIPDYKTYPESDVYLVDDILLDTSRNAMYFRGKLWPNGVIPYVIDSNYPLVVKNRINAALREIEYDVNTPGQTDCINFVSRSREIDYLKILPRGTSCISSVGRSRGMQEVSIGRGCEHKGVIMHELMHAIGFWHEIGRPDRRSHVSIDFDNIETGHNQNFKIYRFAKTLNTSYDFGSILQYGAYSFGIDGTKPTIVPLDDVPDGVKLGQRQELSKTDVLKIQRLYGCLEDTSHIHRPVTPAGGYCDFAHGLCDFVQETDDDFDWLIMNSSSSTTGPGSGATIGRDNYAVAKASGHNGQRAWLTSLVFTEKTLCVNLDLWNFASEGRLKIHVRPMSRPELQYPIASYTSDNEKAWFVVIKSINVPSNYPEYQLVFEANTIGSDIAIDNINIYVGECM